jgi:hypothetical protein
MSGAILSKAVSLVFEKLASEAASLGVPGAKTLAAQVRITGAGIESLYGEAKGAAENQPPVVTLVAVGLGVILGTAGSIILAPGLAALAAAALGISASAGLEIVAGAAASWFISVGVEAGIKQIAADAPQVANALMAIADLASSALAGTLAPTKSAIPSDVITWGSGVSSDASYIQLGSDLTPTNTTITVTGQSAATAQAFGVSPSGPSFTLTYNADGTVNEAVQNVTLDQNQASLDGNDNIQIDGILSVGPAITGHVTAASLTNDGTINVGDPTSLTLSEPVENDGIITTGPGSDLVITGEISANPDLVAPGVALDDGVQGNITATGIALLGSSSTQAVGWTGKLVELGVSNWTTYDRLSRDIGHYPANPVFSTYGGLNSIAGLAVGGQDETNGELLSEDEIIPGPAVLSYRFSQPVEGMPFFLWDPGTSDKGNYLPQDGYTLPNLSPTSFNEQSDTGPYTFTFSASLNGVPVSTAGWSFSIISSEANMSPSSTYQIDASAGTVTVTSYNGGDGNAHIVSSYAPDVVIVIPNTPIDYVQVSALTTNSDHWGLALPSPGGQIQIDNGGTADLQSAVSSDQVVRFGAASGTLILEQPNLFAATIAGFVAGDVIDLGAQAMFVASAHAVAFDTSSPVANYSFVGFDKFTQILTVDDPVGNEFTLQFDPSGDLSGSDFVFTPVGASEAIISVACFMRGTHIATDQGTVSVEGLSVGDLVKTHFGGLVPIKWIGYRRVDCHRYADPRKVWPVRISGGALGEGVPRRDLLLSPDHAMFIEDVLIPVKYLLNGTSVTQIKMAKVIYFHVELDRHDVLLAEGAPAESFLPTGDRSDFENGGSPLSLHPTFCAHSHDSRLMWEALGCAPLVVAGPALEAARQRLQARVDCAASPVPKRAEFMK